MVYRIQAEPKKVFLFRISKKKRVFNFWVKWILFEIFSVKQASLIICKVSMVLGLMACRCQGPPGVRSKSADGGRCGNTEASGREMDKPAPTCGCRASGTRRGERASDSVPYIGSLLAWIELK